MINLAEIQLSEINRFTSYKKNSTKILPQLHNFDQIAVFYNLISFVFFFISFFAQS